MAPWPSCSLVAKALVDIETTFKGEEGRPVTGAGLLDISRDDIAKYVGTATEGKIRIVDMAKLKNLLY